MHSKTKPVRRAPRPKAIKVHDDLETVANESAKAPIIPKMSTVFARLQETLEKTRANRAATERVEDRLVGPMPRQDIEPPDAASGQINQILGYLEHISDELACTAASLEALETSVGTVVVGETPASGPRSF